MTRYTLDVTEAQAQTIEDALDFYARVVGLAQLDEVASAHRMHLDLSSEAGSRAADTLATLMDAAKRCVFGLRSGASRGIHHPDVPVSCRMMYDLRRVVRRALAGRRVAELEAEGDTESATWVRRSVDMDRIAPVGEGPMAVVTVKEGER